MNRIKESLEFAKEANKQIAQKNTQTKMRIEYLYDYIDTKQDWFSRWPERKRSQYDWDWGLF